MFETYDGVEVEDEEEDETRPVFFLHSRRGILDWAAFLVDIRHESAVV